MHTTLHAVRASLVLAPVRPQHKYAPAAQAAAFGGLRQNLNENADGIIPAWTPDPHSPLANLTAEMMSDVASELNFFPSPIIYGEIPCGCPGHPLMSTPGAGQPAKVVSAHAGLEAGSLQARLPGSLAVSIGPTLHDVHTPQEVLEVRTVSVTIYCSCC